jgi:hypothetical protein
MCVCVCVFYTHFWFFWDTDVCALKYPMLTENYFFAIQNDFSEDLLVVQSPLLLMLRKRRRYALATILFLKRSWLCRSCIRGIPWPCVLVPIVSQLYCVTFVIGLRVMYVFMFRRYVKGRSTLSVLLHWMGRNFKVSSFQFRICLSF